jgi:hypothetical protein
MDRFDWERVIARAELPLITKAIGAFLAMHANPDGSNVHPGEERLADITGKTERYVRDQIALLRDLGLIERVQHGKVSERFDRYQLTVPGAGHEPIRMRMDPKWQRIEPRPEPKKRGPRKPKSDATGNGVPVDNPVYRQPASGSDPVDNSASGSGFPVDKDQGSRATGNGLPSYRKPATDLPEAGFREPSMTILRPTTGSSQATHSPTASANSEENDQEVLAEGPNGSVDEYAAATEILSRFEDPTPWFAAAFAELAAAGLRDPPMTDVAIRAAELATRPATDSATA